MTATLEPHPVQPISARRLKRREKIGWWSILEILGYLTAVPSLLAFIGALSAGDYGTAFLAFLPLLAGAALVRFAHKLGTTWLCSNCRNKLTDREARICAVCHAALRIIVFFILIPSTHAQLAGGWVGRVPIPSAREEAADRQKFLSQLCQHPFRKITRNGETQHCDLRPLFAFHMAGSRGLNPMPAWKFLSITVINADSRGVLGSPGASDQPIHLIHYPRTTIPDGTRLRVLAIQSGMYTYTDIRGARRTVIEYDFGAPFTPSAAETETSSNPSTNTPAISEQKRPGAGTFSKTRSAAPRP